MTGGRLLTLLGSIGLAGGSIMPWAQMNAAVFGISVNRSMMGVEGDGAISGIIGVILLLVALLYKGSSGKTYSVATSLLAFVAGTVVVNTLVHLTAALNQVTGTAVSASVGSGIYVSLLGALLAVVGGFVKVPGDPAPKEPASTTNA
jgi:hypothetical protein